MSALEKVSINFASLKSNPFSAAQEIPISDAIGVAKAKAQGQAITITEIETIKACSKSPPYQYQPTKVKIAKSKIVIEKYLESSLVVSSISGFEARASSKSVTILFKVEFA